MNKGISGSMFTPISILFLGLTGLFFLLARFLPDAHIDYRVLHMGNIILFIVGLLSVRMNMQALVHKRVQVFLRLVYGSFIMKFFILAIVAFIYIFIHRKNIDKPALFGCFGLYFIYTFLEVRTVLKMSKKPNA